MSEMVERVARALAREDVIAAIAQGDEQTRGHSAIEVAVAGMKAESRLWSSYTKQARAAIAAIPELTTMLHALADIGRDEEPGEEWRAAKARRIYADCAPAINAAVQGIDEALKP